MNLSIKFLSPALWVVGLLAALIAPAYATFPGKNGRIAFILGPDVYTMNPDGSDVKQLTNVGPENSSLWASWSPDGKQIVFNEYRSPDFLGQLWVMNADGTNQHLLLAEDQFDEERPSFTPDGNSVAFSRCRLDIETCALYQVPITGGALTPITDFELGIHDISAEYSPDNTSVAFTSTDRDGIICAIYLTTTHGSKLFEVTPPRVSARQPDWSPDGKQIAFSTHCRNPQNEEIWVVNADGSGLRSLTKNGKQYFAGPHDFHPSWSPQSDAIVFERDAPDFSSLGIFIMKRDGSSCMKLMSLGNSARVQVQKTRGGHQPGDRMAARRAKEIEEGGAMPRWGVASN